MNAKQSGCYQQVDKKYYKVWHFGNTGGKYFTATYCITEIIKSTGISFRNKTMADNYCFF